MFVLKPRMRFQHGMRFCFMADLKDMLKTTYENITVLVVICTAYFINRPFGVSMYHSIQRAGTVYLVSESSG